MLVMRRRAPDARAAVPHPAFAWLVGLGAIVRLPLSVHQPAKHQTQIWFFVWNGGQSRRIVVRKSRAERNVAGIEIENCFEADVHDNIAQYNTGGILIFDLPNLPQMGGHSIRVFDNIVADNDTPNFAPKGNIVATVPMGTGVMIMANRDVHVFNNALEGNATANVMIVAYKQAFDDPKYEPRVRNVVVRDNLHGRAGFAPDFPGGKELAAALGGSLLPIFWDGVGGADANIQVKDAVGVLSLNLSKPTSPVTEAKPAPADLSGGAAIAEPKPVVLPAAMEAAIR
jgi:hypothetical protein